MVKKACVVTTTRAEYGLLKPLIQAFDDSPDYQLQLIVSGTHLSAEFGMTWQVIQKDGFAIDAKIDMLLSSDSPAAVTKSLGLFTIGLAEALDRLSPDFVVILGDRYEMLAAASAANLFRIPVVHLHGGEITEGALDDSFRHALTKLSHVHFTSTEAYKNRVIQLGEQPHRVFNVGAIGIDNIKTMTLLSKEELAAALDIKLESPYFLVTYHPVTTSSASAQAEIDDLMQALLAIDDTQAIITLSNADVGGREINERLRWWASQYPERLYVFASLGQLRYLSAMQHCLAVVGNSSSGIVEAPSMQKPTVNIGLRQEGRIQADSIVNCEPEFESIQQSIQQVTSDSFINMLSSIKNPYGEGNTAPQIMEILANVDWNNLIKKKFYDITP